MPFPIALLIEDEPLVAEVLGLHLRHLGFDVVRAQNAIETFAAWNEYKNNVEILLVDVVLPGMRGDAIADELKKDRPDVPIVFMSGNPMDTLNPSRFDSQKNFLRKPFTYEQLAHRITQCRSRRTSSTVDPCQKLS